MVNTNAFQDFSNTSQFAMDGRQVRIICIGTAKLRFLTSNKDEMKKYFEGLKDFINESLSALYPKENEERTKGTLLLRSKIKEINICVNGGRKETGEKIPIDLIKADQEISDLYQDLNYRLNDMGFYGPLKQPRDPNRAFADYNDQEIQ